MPLYRITAPNGQTYQIEGPPGASDAEVAQAVLAQNPEAGQAPKQSTIGSELVRGGKQLVSSARTGLESIFNPEEAAKAGIARSEAIGQEAGEGVGFEPVKKAYQEKGLLSAAGEAVSQIPRALAGQGANLATMAGGARLGAMAGSAIAPGVGTVIGGALGAGATLLPQFMGSNVERQAAEQIEEGKDVKIDRTKAYTTAAGQAALEGAGTAFTLGKRVVKGVLGIADDAALATAKSQAELVKAAQRSLAASAGRGAIQGAAEIPVEVSQQILERYQAGLDLTSPDALKEYGESAYQAVLIGGPLGAAGKVAERGGAKSQLAQQQAAEAQARAEQERNTNIGAQLPPEVPKGTQGTLFSEEEMGKRVREPKEPPVTQPTSAAPQGEQLDLGIDFQRDYADIVKERERLKAVPQTAEVKARVKELNDQLLSLHENEVASIRAEKAQEAEARARFPGLAETAPIIPRTQADLFSEEEAPIPAAQQTAEEIPEPVKREPKGGYQYKLPLRTVPEGKEPNRNLPIPARPTEITMQDLEDIGVPMRTSQKWLEQNVIGKTPAEIQVLVGNNPDLLLGTGARAQILKYLTAPVPEGFKEEPRVTPTTQTNKPKQITQPRGSKPSVGVSGQPASTDVVQPGAGIPTTPGTPTAPVGLGLAPAGQPAGKGATTQTAAKPTLNALTPTTAVTPPAAPAAPAEKPAVAAKPAPKAPVAKKVETPAPAKPAETVSAETAEEEAARKAEAEDMKRRLEALEKKVEPRATATPTAKTEAPKAEPSKPIPEKLREPVGTTEYGAESDEEAILRGPQGMLFPMSKREERAYAEDKQRDVKAEAEKPAKVQMVPRDSRQGRLDLQERKEEPKAPETPKAAAIPKWASDNTAPGFTPVYGDDDIALYRAINAFGNQVYIGVNKARNGLYTNRDIESYTGKDFTPEQRDTLLAARSKAAFEESKRASKYPDGPFTNATTNVAKSDSVDQRYADYLRELMSSMGLGDVRIFLVHPEDMHKPGAQDKYRLYKSYETAQTAGFKAGEEGSAQNMGPYKRDFYISFKPGMSENKSLEVISHELGHVIEAVAYNNAPQETKDAIRKEYEAWLQTTKGKTGRELVQMLRNRETADTQMLSVDEGKTAEQMSAYWTLFTEWFADNTSRWASTSEKPVSIVEKFFSKVAQMMRDLVATVTGRKYPPNKKVAEFLDAMGPGSAALWVSGQDSVAQPSTAKNFSVSVATENLVNSMGPLSAPEESALTKMVNVIKSEPEIDYVTKARTLVADIAATIESRLNSKFDGAVRDSLGKLNPMGLYRQAQDYTKMLLEYFQTGTLYKDPATGLWMSGQGKGVRPPAEVYALIDKYADKNGYSRDRATQIASRVLEGVRLNEMRRSNQTGMTKFAIHLKDNEIDQLVQEYNADPDLQEMSKLMDEARIAMVDNMVKVGRLTKEMGEEWKSVVGYVPFDRIEDFATNFSRAKKISGKGIAQLGKLPELIGSETRMVGNVFDNYINTLGWMVGQTMKTDATVTTLRSLEDLGYATKLRTGTKPTEKSVGTYVDGEMTYWSVPSKYDVMAFKDLNPPKAGWLRNMGAFSNVLRKTVTVLPPFALKQVTDDVQRAILTSGVKNPGALVWMSLTNFPKLALAELRGIQHPMVKEFGRLGLTGEYDFEAGKPATSLLKDLGYKERGRFETILHRLDGITRASDLAVRKAIYDQTMKESGDAVLAQTRAREFINFRRRGSSDFVGAMVTTIPFFNAYIQGMDVLYRAASGKDSSASVDRAQARRLFWSRASTVMMLSSLYALGKDDEDEDYKEMDLRTRDSNWIFPGGYKLPVPGELGAIFKVIPERVVEYMKRQGTPEEQTAWEATRTTLHYMFEQYVGRAIPVPQAIKPVMEAWANKSFLTGRDLEGYHHKAMDPSMRVSEQTSELAKTIAVFSRDEIGVEVSPIMIDNALRGYFGSSAAMLTMVTDSLLNPTRVDRPLHKYALLSNYLYDPVGTRRMTEFYEEREKVGKANNTLRELMKTDLDRAEKYAEEHATELMMESAINSTLEQLERTRAYRKYLNSPEGANDMSKEDREADLKEVKKMELEFVQWVREAKAELRKVQ